MLQSSLPTTITSNRSAAYWCSSRSIVAVGVGISNHSAGTATWRKPELIHGVQLVSRCASSTVSRWLHCGANTSALIVPPASGLAHFTWGLS